MGRMATYTGKVVEWENAMNADDNMIPKYLSWNSNPQHSLILMGTTKYQNLVLPNQLF